MSVELQSFHWRSWDALHRQMLSIPQDALDISIAVGHMVDLHVASEAQEETLEPNYH